MRVVVRREPLSALSDYASVPIAFTTTTVLKVEWIANGLGGVRMVEAPLGQPLTKDFDGDEPVMSWHRFGNISHWGIFAAFSDEHRVGGAVVAQNSPGIHMLEGREDLAVLWDLRVHPSVRRGGVGTCLLDRAIRVRPSVWLFIPEGRVAKHQPRRLSLLRYERTTPRRLTSGRLYRVPR